MWKKTYSKFYPNVNPEAIWAIWVDVNNWTKWHSDLEYCKLEGAFEVGNHFMLKPKGSPAVKIMLTEINEGVNFTDCTKFIGAKMTDTHYIEAKDGGVLLTNKLTVSGSLKWLWVELVAQNIADSVPDEMEALVRLAKLEGKKKDNPPFGFNSPDHSPGFLLWQTTTGWHRLVKKALEQYQVSHAQFVIMAILLWWKGKKTDVTQVDLVKMSKLDKMTISKSLKKLVENDLVIRHEYTEDTRAKTVYLTKTGIHLVKKLVPIVESIDAKFFGQLKRTDQTNLIKVLQKLSKDKIED